MAKNLQAKLPAEDSLLVFDINSDAVKRFLDETSSSGGAKVEVAETVRAAAENSVSNISLLNYTHRISSSFI